MSLERLTNEEIDAIHDPKDVVYLEIVKTFEREQTLHFFDVYLPRNLAHYNEKQEEWLNDDRFYLGEKLGHYPTELEFIEDYTETTHNAQRFRAYYVLKYPYMVSRSD